MARETWVQSQVESYQRLKKWYLMPPCLTLSIIRYGSRIKWSNPGEGVAPSPTPRCSSYRKGSLQVTLDYGQQLLHIDRVNLLWNLWVTLCQILFIYDLQMNSLLVTSSWNKPRLICLHTVKWFKVLLSKTNNSFQHYSILCTQWEGF